MGSILLKEGQFNRGITLLKRANDRRILDSKDLDEETGELLKNLIKKYSD